MKTPEAKRAELCDEIDTLERSQAKKRFPALFKKGCELLGYDEEKAARAFGTSRPNTSRWMRGEVVPPATKLILKFVQEDLKRKKD